MENVILFIFIVQKIYNKKKQPYKLISHLL
jgi:hypothetical protein